MGVESHQWVKLTYVPIDVEPQDDGTLSTFVHDGQQEMAEEDATLACWHCMIELTTESYTTPCPGSH